MATSLPCSHRHLGVRGLFGGAVILRDMGPGGGITFRPVSIIIGLASISPLNRLRSGLGVH